MQSSTEVHCHVTDPHTNQLIAKIPINISARSLFSKYSIAPERGINFGPFMHGSKKSRQFTIKNEGEFEFRFSISKYSPEETPAGISVPGTAHQDSSGLLPRITKKVKPNTNRKGEPFPLGDFIINPSSATVPVGGSAKVNVEFSAENGGTAFEVV